MHPSTGNPFRNFSNSFFPHITASMADLDKDTLRIASVFTRFPEVAPFIFEVQMDVTANTISSRRVHTFQKRIVE